ncbi:nuclear transport factor 2 family protein [Variovorax sp. KK3]|uniref:nuclear transport factor 2 family protein n=1 Tax=Variovorax sp. KK3 TaxID=1855728 RepID=UPI00097C5C4E|nr:nuclear transport factor 2 family protein [Variovorax sp. KK3]
MPDFEPSLQRLLDAQAIAETKARYCRYIDTKQWQRLASLFTADCRFEGLGSAPAGADVATFVQGVSTRLADTISVHHCHMPEIRFLTPGHARAVWAMEDYVEWTDGGTVKEAPGSKGFRGYGHYEEEYRAADDGEWKICFLRLTRLRIDPVDASQPPALPGQRQATPGWPDAI